MVRNCLFEIIVNCIELLIRVTPLLSQVEKQSKQQLTKSTSTWFDRYWFEKHANSVIKEIRTLKRDWREKWVDLCSGKYFIWALNFQSKFSVVVFFYYFFLKSCQNHIIRWNVSCFNPIQEPPHTHAQIKKWSILVFFLFGYFFSDSSMLGERDRIRNAVGWELDDTATSSNNNGVQQSSWVSGIGNVGDGTENNNSVGAAARSYSDNFCE